MLDIDEDAVYSMDLDKTNHLDLIHWLFEDKLVGIVSEDDGGIIAYCHYDFADSIVKAMNDARH